jgi:hypothetical protein
MNSDVQLVVFRCRSCEFRNKMTTRKPGVDPEWQTDFTSLTDAISHITANEGHDIVAIMEPEDRDDPGLGYPTIEGD